MDIGQQYYCLTKRGAKASKRPLLTSSSSPNIDGLSTTTLPKLTLGNATSGLNSCGKVPIWTRHKSANEITFDDEEAATVFSFDAHLEGLRDSFFVTAK